MGYILYLSSQTPFNPYSMPHSSARRPTFAVLSIFVRASFPQCLQPHNLYSHPHHPSLATNSSSEPFSLGSTMLVHSYSTHRCARCFSRVFGLASQINADSRTTLHTPTKPSSFGRESLTTPPLSI